LSKINSTCRNIYVKLNYFHTDIKKYIMKNTWQYYNDYSLRSESIFVCNDRYINELNFNQSHYSNSLDTP